MSRIGKKPVSFPADVTVSQSGQAVSVKGPNGDLTLNVHPNMTVSVDEGERQITVTRSDDLRENRALHGLTRSLLNNMVTGVTTPFVRSLVIMGVGYNGAVNGNNLSLQVGFANTIVLPIPEGVSCECTAPTRIVVKSADKQAVGQFAANIRRVRPPEPYKGKGIRYEDEQIRRKAGKAFGSK